MAFTSFQIFPTVNARNFVTHARCVIRAKLRHFISEAA